MLTLDDGNHGMGQVVQMIKGEPNTEVILTIEAQAYVGIGVIGRHGDAGQGALLDNARKLRLNLVQAVHDDVYYYNGHPRWGLSSGVCSAHKEHGRWKGKGST